MATQSLHAAHPGSPVSITVDGTTISPVPPYSITDENTLFGRIERAKDLTLPITHVSCTKHRSNSRWYACTRHMNGCITSNPQEREIFNLRRDIVAAFFAAIESGNDDIVVDFIARGYVSPDVTGCAGETPLLAAVCMGSLPIVSRLVAMGATVNAFGMASHRSTSPRFRTDYRKLTPLQLAAYNGNLAIVRALMEDYGADDSLIAPDGSLALRLAADSGHREIVAYLPARRGGAMLRWREAHQSEMKIIKHTIDRICRVFHVLLWRIPRVFLYKLPKHIWDTRHYIIASCKSLPRRIKKHLVRLPEHMKTLGTESVRFIRKLPDRSKRVVMACWRTIKEIPKVLETIIGWFSQGLKTIGKSVFNIATKLVSLVHTVLAAVFSFLRSITLKDAWNGFCILVKAIFVDAPIAIWSFLKTFGELSYKVLGNLFGGLGKAVWCLIKVLIKFALYLPAKAAKIVAALCRLLRKGFRELMVQWDPKRL